MSIVRTRPAATFDAGQVHPELAELGAEQTARAVARYAAAVARLALSFTFLWAFFDKAFGLGKSTASAKSWINGGSPTKGFLGGVKGTFHGMFNSMAGVPIYDWLFMLALLGVGTALLLGIGMRIATVSGGLLLVMMWAASLPLATNPFLDDHLIYATVLVLLTAIGAGRTLGIGAWWEKQALVKRFPVLR
ncbi:MAG: hypothetical protein JWM93_2538 [Frankiales bacterium]|nr:hypothetical protein [Frankiales bacterium]